MRIVVIGGSGHIGSYLIPHLVEKGHEVINVSRSIQKPYLNSKLWTQVRQVTLDRIREEKNNTFATKINELNPDVVIDNICFTKESAKKLAEGLLGHIKQLVVIGSIWVHGYSTEIPTKEGAKRTPIGEYGINKNEIEQYLLTEFDKNKLPVTVLHPGHIVGKGWPCLNPQGNFNLDVFQTIINGEVLLLPNLGLESVHHVHAEDIKQLIQSCIQNPKESIGESFHVVSAQAMTLRGYAEAFYKKFNHKPKIEFLPLSNLKNHLSNEDFAQTEEHVQRSPCISIEKAQTRLAYKPSYSSIEACFESVDWMIKSGKLKLNGNLLGQI